ncbi:MAG: mandelate racemase/muconate lactonizing enzyme family protein [Bacteroidetes bacterium]|nr:MAG: mandelate racemase/muconate lactonizing enzyme family protein [Bacteroidota bacterium]
MKTKINRRNFLMYSASIVPFSTLFLNGRIHNPAHTSSDKIKRIEVVKYKCLNRTDAHLEIESDSGKVGVFGTLGWGIPDQLNGLLPQLSKLLINKDPLNQKLEFATLWEGIYPNKPLIVYEKGIDPLTGQNIWGTTRGGRHSPTGLQIMTLSAVDNALWDLRGKILGQPVYRLAGKVNRPQLQVYSRVGEGNDLKEARRIARERYDMGQNHQKWYFVYGPKDGKEGMFKNLELVRTIREELGSDAKLMFDNHSMRYEVGPEWVVQLAKDMIQYNPFWLEEPTAPEDLEGYARIKGETGITIAGGEHHFTRWQIKPLLERKCIDWVQLDPDWCGGISEWLRACEMVKKYPGVKIVPHCDNFMTNVQCVASQPESLCPLVEYNDTQTERKMSFRTRILRPESEILKTPEEPGLGPDLNYKMIERI